MKKGIAAAAALAALLAGIAPLRAQSGAQDPDLSGIQASLGASIKQFHQDMAGQSQERRKQEDKNNQILLRVLEQAKLSPTDLASRGWTPEQIHSLARAILIGSVAVSRLHAEYPSAVADAYKNTWWHLDAELTNLEQSAEAGIAEISGNAQAKAAEFKRGCLAHQQAVYAALSRQSLPRVEVRKIMIGTGLEHHAVVVFPAGGDWSRAGVVLDGWLNQSAQIGKMTFPVRAWESNFALLRVIASARLED